MPQLTERNQLM